MENVDIFESRRIVLIDGLDYPFGLSEINLNTNESSYILIKD